MTIETLKAAGGIYLENIQKGFDEYHWEVRKLNAREAEKEFKRLRMQAGDKNAFLDFYYFSLPETAQSKIRQKLEQEELHFLEDFRKSYQGDLQTEVIFPLTDDLLKIAVKLNEAETLFSTIYFTGKQPQTWWGNYGKEYVKFT